MNDLEVFGIIATDSDRCFGHCPSTARATSRHNEETVLLQISCGGGARTGWNAVPYGQRVARFSKDDLWEITITSTRPQKLILNKVACRSGITAWKRVAGQITLGCGAFNKSGCGHGGERSEGQGNGGGNDCGSTHYFVLDIDIQQVGAVEPHG